MSMNKMDPEFMDEVFNGQGENAELSSYSAFKNNSVMELASYYRLKKTVSNYLVEHSGGGCNIVIFSAKRYLHLNEIHGTEAVAAFSRKIEAYMNKQVAPGECFAKITDNRYVLFLICSMEKAKERVSDYFDAISEIMIHDRLHPRIRFICGIYNLTAEDDDFIKTVDKATAAMLSADSFSSSTEIVVYDKKIYTVSLRRSKIEAELLNGIIDRRELVVEIQPKFDLKTGDCVSAEALVRWNHPQLGRIMPDEFIPIAEQTGSIIDIDMYVLETVCRYMRKWMDMGCNYVPVAVNQSRVHISDPNYVDSVYAMMQKYDVWTNLIELETTETIAFDDMNAVTKVLSALHECGFIISMDDFGSGYSSMHMLSQLEYDVLKLDQKLIRLSEDNADRSKKLLKHIIALAHDLDMRVVAEGVETEEQAEMLRSIDCDIAQGFLYAHPMPIDKFEGSLFGQITPGLPQEYM
ncbi:MAG: EAL domain-containing protein [Oscillospiraceae bacterium]|nr:EAL domain-containing protein [Oscillospiraceae bacterium]